MSIASNAYGGDASLRHVDAAVIRSAFHRDEIVVFEFPETMPQEAPVDCKARRRFAVFKHPPEGQGVTSTSNVHQYDLEVLLCQDGPFGVQNYKSTLEASQRWIEALEKSEPSMTQALKGREVRIGKRSGRALVLLSIGHGVVMTPLAVIDSQDPAFSLLVVLDEPHVGEPDHLSMGEAIELLANLLAAADRASTQ